MHIPRNCLLSVVLLGTAGLIMTGCAVFRSDGGDEKPVEVRVEVEAPIESVDILVLESFPAQYMVHIVSGLPNGCADYERTELLARDGDTFRIRVTNTMPEDPETACDLVYRTHESNLNLGSPNFVSGTTYTLDVNGTTETFVAQ